MCTDTSTGEERLRGEVAAAWHRDRTATDFAAAESSAHEAQVRVWNGSDAYGQSAVARNWYARLYLARWRQRLAETAKSAATRMGSGASVEAIGRRRLRRRHRRFRWRLASVRARRGILPSLVQVRGSGHSIAKGDDWHGLSRIDQPRKRKGRSCRPAVCALTRLCAACRLRHRAHPSSSSLPLVLRNARVCRGGQRELATRGQVPAPQRAKPAAASD